MNALWRHKVEPDICSYKNDPVLCTCNVGLKRTVRATGKTIVIPEYPVCDSCHEELELESGDYPTHRHIGTPPTDGSGRGGVRGSHNAKPGCCYRAMVPLARREPSFVLTHDLISQIQIKLSEAK